MKLLACGDFHIGSGADYGPGPGGRLRDQEQVLEQIVKIACEEDVAAVLFAGDAFERRTPTPSELMVWRRFVTALRDERIPLLGIAGNHDVAAADLPTGIEVVGACGRTPEIAGLGDVTLATLPWTPPARLVAAEGGGDRDQIHERAAELLLETARGLREQIDGPAILLAHWSVSWASLPNGLATEHLREPVLDINELAAIGFDFVVLGHIHKPQLLGGEEQEGAIFYVGSPMPLNFGEGETDHGVFIIDTEAHFASFHHVASRPFVTVHVDLVPTVSGDGHARLPDGDDFLPNIFNDPDYESDAIAARIAEHFPLTGAVVRLRYRATAEQTRRVDHAALRGLLADAGASKLYAIQPEIVRSERGRVAGVDETIDEIEAFKFWLEASGTTISPVDGGPLPELEEQLLERHARYLEEVVA